MVLSATQQDIYDVVLTIRQVNREQLYELCKPRSKGNVERAIEALKRYHLIFEKKDYIMAVDKEKIAYDVRDCLWVMLENIEKEEDLVSFVKNVVYRPPSCTFLYIKNNMPYYMIYIQSEKDFAKLHVLEEKLNASGGKTALLTAKIIVVTATAELLDSIPKTQYPLFAASPKYSNMQKSGRPELIKVRKG